MNKQYEQIENAEAELVKAHNAFMSELDPAFWDLRMRELDEARRRMFDAMKGTSYDSETA